MAAASSRLTCHKIYFPAGLTMNCNVNIDITELIAIATNVGQHIQCLCWSSHLFETYSIVGGAFPGSTFIRLSGPCICQIHQMQYHDADKGLGNPVKKEALFRRI